ncbi:unnamed protein product [Toxocara canis]|uniref:Reverse transcriptase domain-containing protein n=1 Tax=Toxocara canis TaxID=6265 RepID=A0A183UWQ8_TOXCA|nr:unnamed protein product [Toxocara canis]
MDDNLHAHATSPLVAIALPSISIRASEKGAAKDRVTLMKVAEQMFGKRDQEMMTVGPQTARETEKTTARVRPYTARGTEETTARLLNIKTATETKETTARLPGLETANETEEATACLIEPETARETEETTACLPDAEAYQQFCRTWKDVRMPRGTKTTKRSIIVINACIVDNTHLRLESISLAFREIPDVRIRTNTEICEDELGSPIAIPLEELNRMELITEERLQEPKDEQAKEETKKMVINMEVVQTEE